MKPLVSRTRGVEWKFANFAVERVVEGIYLRGDAGFREGVLGVLSLAGRPNWDFECALG